MKHLSTRYIKQRPSETQRFFGVRDAGGIKLGFTMFLSVSAALFN
ncbi:MAG: hypothetical protein OXI63_08655 [Candidatus Poribacteria bacterium]|nr:hypothetical protein [Candidatus Poribacteria bacterium]